MALRKIIEGIYASDDGLNGGNYGAIVLDDEVVMIDSGMIHQKSKTERNFLEQETKLPIKKLIFTHTHADHVFGAQAFEPITMIASQPTINRIVQSLDDEWNSIATLRERYSASKSERPELWEAIQTLVIRVPDTTFENHLSIGSDGQITVKHLGGHTSGSSIIISHLHNTVFIGDLIFNGTFPYGGDPTCDPDRWILALEEVHSEEYDVIIPGHGKVCGQNELTKYIEALQELRENVKIALDIGLSVESFVDRDMVPKSIENGFDRFGIRTLPHWFEFYG